MDPPSGPAQKPYGPAPNGIPNETGPQEGMSGRTQLTSTDGSQRATGGKASTMIRPTTCKPMNWNMPP